ncbi:MAG: cytochrome c oxidase assembly protein [Gammaproteobacteria bacterium]|nr:cytochrome c oxidase assembly protein [Gammaproteobacteria bacterium]
MTKQSLSTKTDNKKIIAWLLVAVLCSFCFCYALVPLYNTFCKITGVNGKTAGRYKLDYAISVDPSRTIRIQFTTSLNKHLPWEFKPQVRSIDIHPGELKQVSFYAKNLSNKTIIGRAIPSITPGQASSYMHKTECFCFNEQPLKAGESIMMPLVFFIDKNLPKDITEMTLSYTMFDTQTVINKI